MKRLGNILFLLVVLLASGGGCDKDETTQPTTPEYLPRTTPENVLENLLRATRKRDFVAYRDQLDPAYQFRFRPQEAGRFGMPVVHDLSDELCAAKEMFTDPRVDTLRISLTHGESTAVTDSSAPRRALRQIDVSAAYLFLVGPTPGNDAIGDYECAGRPQRLFFSADTMGSREPRYSLLRHCELDHRGPLLPRSAETRTPPESWGWVKYNMLLVSEEPGGPCSD